MARLKIVDPAKAEGQRKALLDAVQSALGVTPNMMRIMANSPAVLEGYLNLNSALGNGSLKADLREQIALAVAEANSCQYCLSAHTAIGKMVGLDERGLASGRQARSDDARVDSILKFARSIVTSRGNIADKDFQQLRSAGVSDEEAAEVVANVALNVFANYFNLVSQTDLDFPKVAPLATTAP
jgi:uncharacterized peroxidase-related enzyme